LQRLHRPMIAEKTAIQQQSGSEDLFWQAVVHRDPTFDGLLFYGVRSTRIYCRPTCSSRKPQRHNEEILYTIIHSPLGFLLVAATQRGLCSVRLGSTAFTLEQELKQEFKAALLQPADVELQQWTQTFIDYLSGICPLPTLPIDVQATAFQLQVWQALQTIPVGTTASYSDIARQMGCPTSVRAVARACATNPVALVIPCHRVVQKDGSLGGYRWGVHLKQKLLNLEAHFPTS
jgi:AraC family transcriptional regulator of adaptative response/methylated-DNA-[protein]-cysteine methyltransferase